MAFQSAGELLTIQKFIFLLDDFHFGEFESYLKSIRAALPLKLSRVIREKLPEFDMHETLCKKIYGVNEKNQKQSFNQLSSYTFKLSSYLALNYPAYLSPNETRIQVLVNTGKYREANFLAETLEDVARRVEDFGAQIRALEFLSQQAAMINDGPGGARLDEKLEKALENEMRYTKLQSELRKDGYREKPLSAKEFALRKTYYKSLQNDPVHRIKIISSYAYLRCMVQNDARFFTKDEDLQVLSALERELKNYSYLVFPFMSDIRGNITFQKINSPLYDPVAKETLAVYNELSEHYKNIRFWNSYLNMGELHLITHACTRLLTAYHCFIHRKDYHEIITPADQKTLKELIAKCTELINKDYYEKKFEYGVRHLTMLRGALLIISGGGDIGRGLHELESLLTAYQQVNLKASTDSIYLCLMVGYFSIKDYSRCVQTFKRYTKNTKGKPVFQPNDTKIYSYYYLARWLLTGSRQYAAKLETMLRKLSLAIHDVPPPSIMEVVHYFQMPVNP